MNCATLPALSFGIFDHLDHAGGSLRQQYSDRLKIAAACDEAGFRAYHVAKHHGTPHALAASPNLFLFAVAQRTRKLRLGPLVMLLNLYHPLRAFEEIWMLDQLSGGRLDLGIGRGAVPLELSVFRRFACRGTRPIQRGGRVPPLKFCPAHGHVRALVDVCGFGTAGGRRWNTPFTELEYTLDGQVCALLAWTANQCRCRSLLAGRVRPESPYDDAV
jgi:hypothetical protein